MMHGWQLKQKLMRRVLYMTGPLLTWAARTGRVGLAVRLMGLHLVRVKAAMQSPFVKVIVLFKVGCTEDVATALSANTRFELFGLDRRVIKAFARAFLPPEIDDNNYCPGNPEYQRAKDRYRGFLGAVWLAHRDRWGKHVVVTGNFGYYAERELATGLEEAGVPFVVMQKENLRSPGQAVQDEIRNTTRRGPFGGRMILQYNEVERHIELRSGVVTPDRTRIVGMPRMDRVHQWRLAHADDAISGQRRILFFLFGLKSGIPTLPRKQGGAAYKLPPDIEQASWREMQTSCINALIGLARSAPDLQVMMKTKGDATSIALMAERFGGADHLPANFRIIVGGDPLGLLVGSTVICGFNSTALLEAIAANKPVIVPSFAEAVRPDMQPYVVELGDAVEYARSADELVARLRDVARGETLVTRGRDLSATQQAVLARWTGNADGRAGERVCEALLDISDAREA